VGRIDAEGFAILSGGSPARYRLCPLCGAEGETDPAAKPLKGFGGCAVMEIVAPFDGNTWRAVYTVRFRGVIYVLHAFQKKSKSGIAPQKLRWM